MRAFNVVAFLLFGLASLRAQDEGSLLVANATAWHSREVGDGVFLRQRWFAALFASPQSLTVLEVRQGAAAKFDLVAPGRRTRTSVMAEQGQALAAINGGFFAIETTGLSIGLLRLDGALVVPASPGQGSLGLTADGRLQLAERPAGDWPETFEALGAGPLLLRDGKVIDHGEGQRQRRHPRSAIGVAKDGRVLWLAVDGRTTKAAGMTFEETARVLAALGCTDALNLDGGGSTTLWVKGHGVCNYPCDNRRYDHEGERAVANALLLRAPAVVVVDDDDAELAGDGWQQRADGDHAHGRDFAVCATSGARATFAAELPFAGRWQVLAWRPAVNAVAPTTTWRVRLPDGEGTVACTSGVGAGNWAVLGEFQRVGASRVEVVFTATLGELLLVDAVRFLQMRD